MAIRYPEYVKKALDRLELGGYEAFIVGGAVRDLLLGRGVNDYDITTSALPLETADIFSDFHVIETGLKHGTVTVVIDKKPIEITTYRIDGDYRDSRHPEGVEFSRNIEDDLARRDFTVNAMAYNEKRGLVDLFGGKADLEAKIIRAVGVPEKRFNEDALRIMRAFRFASKLGFDIEEKTLAAAEACRAGLANISTERKTAELVGIITGAGVKKILPLMKQAKIFEVIASGLNLDETKLERVCELPCDFVRRMAFCLIGEANADAYISSLRLPNAVSGAIRRLILAASEPLDADTDPKLRRLMARVGGELPRLLEIRAVLGDSTKDIRQRADLIIARGDCLDIKSLALGGGDLADLGIKGREVGETLNFLLDAVLDDPSLNEKIQLLKLAREFQTQNLKKTQK